MTAYEDFDEGRIKHMDMIQAVISRLGNDSFLVKGWAVTVSGAFLGFAVNASSWQLAAASLFPSVLFWSLDAYYLWAERLFRALYDCVRRGSEEIEPFSMAATREPFRRIAATCSGEAVASRWEIFHSGTLLLFYGAICVAAAVVLMITLLT
jgi:hypothetical protein